MAGFLNSATINRNDRCFEYAGHRIDWLTMLDGACNLVENADDAAIAVYKFSQEEWTAVDLRLFREKGSEAREHLPWLKSATSCDAPAGVWINRHGKFFRLEDDTVVPFKCMIDINGDVTSDSNACIVAIFQLPDGLYRGLDLRVLDNPEFAEILQ
jgi:hypothetical protein